MCEILGAYEASEQGTVAEQYMQCTIVLARMPLKSYGHSAQRDDEHFFPSPVLPRHSCIYWLPFCSCTSTAMICEGQIARMVYKTAQHRSKCTSRADIIMFLPTGCVLPRWRMSRAARV